MCKACGAEHFYRDGKNKRGLQRYRCRHCGFRFVWSSDLPRRRFFSNIMGFAVELYTDLRKAVSLRGIAELLKKLFKINITYEAVRQWVLTTKKQIYPRQSPIATVWHADETYIRIKGRYHLLWVVYDKYGVLAWHISKQHLIKHAKYVIQQALIIAGTRPEKIITDKLWQYPVAIYKVMGWNKKEHKQKHVADNGVGKNAPIERVNKEIKRRLKWFGSFQSQKGAETFFALWFYHFNQRILTHAS